MKAQEMFDLKIISIENGIALVGDGTERFEVLAESLDQDIDATEDLMSAYDAWCVASAI